MATEFVCDRNSKRGRLECSVWGGVKGERKKMRRCSLLTFIAHVFLPVQVPASYLSGNSSGESDGAAAGSRQTSKESRLRRIFEALNVSNTGFVNRRGEKGDFVWISQVFARISTVYTYIYDYLEGVIYIYMYVCIKRLSTIL